MKKQTLVKRIYRHHLDIVKELNNSHIFIQRTREILLHEIEKIKDIKAETDRIYHVPSRKGKLFSKEAFRTDKELKGLLTEIAERDLFENFIVTNVSRFESYLFKTLTEVIYEYPEKLGINVNGIKPYKTVPIDFVMESQTIEELIRKVIGDRISSISYSTPQQYLQFFQEVTGCKTQEEEFLDYIEIKATRDILVHNDKIVNSIYLEKVGEKKRANINQAIPIDSKYFDFTIATMKRISGIIRREMEKKYNK
jgi:hypothetical protein